MAASRSSEGDRFIPYRSAMDMGFARTMLTDWKEWSRPAVTPVARDGYQKLLRQALLQDRSRILAFKPAPHVSAKRTVTDHEDPFSASSSSSPCSRPKKPRRYIPPCRDYLPAPRLIDDPGLNLLDWGSNNSFTIAAGDCVSVWNPDTDSHLSKFSKLEPGLGPVTSISWSPDGRFLAQGLNNSKVQIWDTSVRRLVRTLGGAHKSRVGSLAWNGCILTTGGGDGLVVSHDHRMRSPTVRVYRGHRLEVCGMKWSASGKRLASGGADHLVHIWDAAMNPRPAYAHRLEDHISRVRALAWCPFNSHLLASGGGEGDNQIRFWDTLTGVCLKSVDTGSQVSGLLWNQKERERELLSAHCSGENTLMLWKYPSMAKIADIRHPIKQLLYMAQSPDNCTVASAGNRKAYFLDIFGDPEEPREHKKPEDPGFFGRFNHIRFAFL